MSDTQQPQAEQATDRPLRTIKGSPNMARARASACDTAGCVRPSRRAAAEIEPSRSTASTTTRRLRS